MTIRGLLDIYFIKQPRLRRWVTKFVYGDQDQLISLAGLNLKINSLRENGYLRAARKCRGSIFLEHELNVLSVLSMISARCDAFVDAGANVGVFSCTIARRKSLDPTFQILAFEPHPQTYKRLVENAQKFGIETYNFALSDGDRVTSFVDGAVSHVFTAAEHQNRYNISEVKFDIPCRRLDSFAIKGQRIMLKIDVEGHELEVLEGARALFEEGRIAAVYCDGHDRNNVPALLSAWGFSLRDAKDLSATSGAAFGLLAIKNGLFEPL